jgi:hypothetical protein
MPHPHSTVSDSLVDSAQPDAQALHEEFRSLLSLLSLVTEDGERHSTLSSSYGERGGLLLESSGSEGISRSLPNAVATLLVRDVEIVAVAASKPSNTMQFAALANPDDKFKYTFGENQHIVVPPGQSFWPSVRDKGWDALAPSKYGTPSPLQNHAATLVDYCNDPRVRNPSWPGTSHFAAFSSYIMSCCWPKMYRRISRWYSQGFIYSLAVLNDAAVLAAFDAYALMPETSPTYSQQRDLPLIQLVLSMSDSGGFQKIMRCYRRPGQDSLEVSFEELLSAFRKAKGEQVEKIYSQGTCVAFHHFLVATLLAYSASLSKLREISEGSGAIGGKEEKAKDLVKAVKELLELSNLLWKISDSKLLEHHAEALESALSLPQEGYKSFYCSFVGGMGLAENEEGRGSGDGLGLEGSKPAKFRHWVRLQASHLEALHLLDSHCCGRKSPSPQIQISLIAVQAPKADLMMENWELTFEKLAHECASDGPASPPGQAGAFEAESAKGTLAKLLERKTASLSKKKSGPKHRPGRKGAKSKFYGRIPHCEALLALLIVCYRESDAAASKNSELAKLLQVRPPALTIANLMRPMPRVWTTSA